MTKESDPAETRRRELTAGKPTELRWEKGSPTLERRGPAGEIQPTIPRLQTAARAGEVTAFGEGYCLRGHYRLERLIGQGAMGQVWRAKDLLGEEARDRNPYVAVKVLNADLEEDADSFVAMHREASRAQKLAHPNIVTVHVFDRDEASGRVFIVMELLEGQPLDRVIQENGFKGLPRKDAIPIVRGMAEGLAYAHRKGIVHSDFKPANVFLTADGTPKILDFGIARAIQVVAGDSAGDAAVSSAAVDDAGFQGYTETYAAPEAIAGEPPNPAQDVFALGIVAYELLSGEHPFRRLSATQAREKGLRPTPLKGVRRREAAVIGSALGFDQRLRPPNAGFFLKRLQGLPVVQQALIGAVGVLIVGWGGLWYRNYLESLPAVPLGSLPPAVQRQFHEQIQEGEASLAYLRRTHDITASADAAEYFAEAYQLHPKDPEAVRGLETAVGYAIAWYETFPDHDQARRQLELFRAKSPFYSNYRPLERAIRATGGD